jgi:hypothetical protein
MIKTLSLFLLVLMATMEGQAQYNNDPHLPGKGNYNGTLLTTYSSESPPPVLIGDVLYGVTNRFAVGVVAGTTGSLGLYGLKVNASLYLRNSFRVLFRFMSVYYPERNGTFLFDRDDEYVMPWMLSMAVFDGEWEFRNGLRISAGAGLMETHCINDMKMWFGIKHDHSLHEEDGHVGKVDSGKLIDVFNTVQGSVSIPLSGKWTLRPEVILVFKGTKLIESEHWKVSFPVNPYLSVVYSF